jgi:hypothetical protein
MPGKVTTRLKCAYLGSHKHSRCDRSAYHVSIP